MDFGSILEQWEMMQKDNKKKKSNATKNPLKQNVSDKRMQEDAKKVANPMDVWLRRYGVIDKDLQADEYRQRSKMEDREFLKNMRPQEVTDLHGMTQEQAWQHLNYFIGECKKRGLKKVLIIHGKGNHSTGCDAVLGKMVRTFIEEDKRLGASGHPNKNHGGVGATWVIIK